MTSIDENVIKQTSEILGKVIKQVPLTDKLLSRPPFKFIHDLIKEIIRNNGFLSGLYTDDELSSESINTKEAKIKFIQKTIDALGFITNNPLNHIKASKIVAGLEVENTNELLQILGKSVISRKSHELAVRKVLNGETPGPSNTNLTVDDLLNENTKQSSSNVQSNSPEKPELNKSTIESSKPIKAPVQAIKTTNANKSTGNLTNKTSSTKKSNNNLTNQTKNKIAIKSKPVNNLVQKKPIVTNRSKNDSTTKSTTNSSTKFNQQTKVTNDKPKLVSQKSPTVKRGQEKIAKPVTKPFKSTKSTNLVNKATNEETKRNESITKNRTLNKDELSALQANKLNNRADEENKANSEDEEAERNVDTINKSISLEMTSNQNVISKSITDQNLNNENQEIRENIGEKAGTEFKKKTSSLPLGYVEQQIDDSSKTNKDDEIENHLDSVRNKKSAINKQEAIKNENEIKTRSSKRPIVSSSRDKHNDKKTNDETINKQIKDESKLQRPITASRPVTARAAPPRAVSRRLIREDKQIPNVIEMVSRPQTSIKQALVTNLIKETNDSLDEDDLDSASSENEKINKRVLTANKEHSLLKDNIRKLDEQNEFSMNDQTFGKGEEDTEKGSLVKKLIKSKLDLEDNSESQNQISSATLVRSNRDIERLKEHIQTLTKLANPLSKLLDNLQEDIDLMLLEERNWIEEQQRNEQQLLVLREQMDEELKNVNLQIVNLDDQIQQEKDAILVTNINLLINQAKLEDIVRRMIEN